MLEINEYKAFCPLFLFSIFLFAFSSYSQTTLSDNKGYIYVHLKTSDENSSPDFTFNWSEGMAPISLNDHPTQLDIKDF